MLEIIIKILSLLKSSLLKESLLKSSLGMTTKATVEFKISARSRSLWILKP